MSNYIININDGQRYSTPVVNRFSSDFDRIRFVLDLSRDLSSYSFGIVAAVCGECFMITEDDEKLVKGYEESTGRITLDWSVGTEITAKDGVVIYQIIAFSADSDGNMKSIWYSPEGRVTVGESIELTEYETAQIGTKPSIIMQLLAKVSSNELSFKELKDADLAHKTEVILDHPDGSVVRAKLSEDLIKILDEAVSKDYFRNIVSPLSDNVELLNENTQILDRRMTEAEENIADNQKAISDITEKLNSNTITSNAKGSKIHIDDSAQAPLGQLNLYGHTKQIYTSGKNMIPYPYHDGSSKTSNGITFTVNPDGSITFNGTATARADFKLVYDYSYKEWAHMNSGAYTICANNANCGSNSFSLSLAIRYNNKESSINISDMNSATRNFNIDSAITDAYMVAVMIVINAGYTANNETIYPMLEKSKKETAFEPYTGNVPSPSPEWPQSLDNGTATENINLKVSDTNDNKTKSLAISTAKKLFGVPVDSGGNYTDENGQMWICDEIDLAKGIYIQRIGSSTLPEFSFVSIYSGTDAGDIYEGFASCAFPCTDAGALCEKAKFVVNRSDYRATEFLLSPTLGMESWCDLNVYCIAEDEEDFRSKLRGASILYILSSPQEKPLSDEEIDAYNKLLTYKPTTNITNDADAYMAVEYAADPKSYIDGKLAALTAAMNLAGVNVNG